MAYLLYSALNREGQSIRRLGQYAALHDLDKELVTMIGERRTIGEIERAARAGGMRSLSDAGMDLVASGEIDIAEYERVL